MDTYYLASTNPFKYREYQQLLALWGIRVHPFTKDEAVAVKEIETTYRGNARLKAMAYSAHYPNRFILSDDSGLILHAFPEILGVETARQLSPYKTDSAKNRAIINQLKGHPRHFTMTSAIVLVKNQQLLKQGLGELTGVISAQERGRYSTGFDRLLIPAGRRETLAELPFLIRRPYLHRYRALKNLLLS
ncbi:MAG: non-canonical purine NTP pyrophosphatase [Aerococcus sp.]|nr:non-canonical purine NTP pyrophosphatase [Aerococcus sp.]